MTSMERFGAVSVDYFTGRKVLAVGEPENTMFPGVVWAIKFEGDGVIYNFDPTIKLPSVIVGAALTRCLLETKMTRLQFGLEQVILNPIEYAIQDPVHTKGELVFAQRSEANMPSLPDMSDHVAEGPTGPEDDDG